MSNAFLRFLQRQRSRIRGQYSTPVEPPRYRTMTSGTGGIAAALYAVTVSTPAALGAVPDTATEKSHWLRDRGGKGEVKGFVNPWESYKDFTTTSILTSMIRQVLLLLGFTLQSSLHTSGLDKAIVG